jgi:diguanylate cyclase (GGDEF)-like protein/PAS domain S-box-containing protein
VRKANSGFLAFAQNEAEQRPVTVLLLALLVLLAVLGGLALAEDAAVRYRWALLGGALTGLMLLGGAVAARGRARATARQTHAEWLEREIAARTERAQLAGQAPAIKEQHWRTLIDAAPVGIAELDAEGYCRYLNPVGCALTDYAADAARGRHFFEFVHPDDRDYVEFIWQINKAHAGAHWLEFRLRGTDFWISAHWVNLFDADRLPIRSIMTFIDSTERRCQDEQVWIKAHYDALTGLPNRSLFWERLSQSLLRARRDHQNIAVLWVDLDGFKAVNDRWGHAAGDELLQQAALRLNGRMRDSDTVARMGGDEFAVVLSDLVEGGAAEPVAANLAVRLAEPFVLGCGTSDISASIGVALYPLHAKDAETLVKYADMAMYAAKRAGKNQVAVWRPDLGETLEELASGDERGSKSRIVPQQIDSQ